MALGRFVFLAFLLWGVFGAVSAQAIDCASQALNNSERAVCASGPLHALATRMDRRYARVADLPGVRQSQAQWIGIRDRCNDHVECLTRAYRERIAYLAGLPAIVNAATASVPHPPAQPIKHLFLRHAPAQWLNTPPVVASTSAGSSRQPDRAVEQDTARNQAPSWSTLWLLGAIVLACIVLWQALANVCGKCPHCHQWFAQVELDRRPVAEESTEPSIRRRAGLFSQDAERARDREPPLAVRHYYQCRVCLHEWETVTQQTE